MIKWRYITSECESASHALAADEYLMSRYENWMENNYPEPVLRIYSMKPHSVLIGRFQNPEAEVDLDECRRLGIPVNRRMTGGGAVMMGEQQLMVSIPSSIEHPLLPVNPLRILPKLARGIINGLALLGINAEYRPKNDIVVNGRKISGTAICIEETRTFLYHATLLIDFDVPLMMRVLKIHPEKASDKGVALLAERLTTISRELDAPISISDVKDAICRGFEQTFKIQTVNMPFTKDELDQIKIIENKKYSTFEWINQRIPAHDMVGEFVMKAPAGLIHTYAALSGNVIKSVLITGDFFSDDKHINDIEAVLKWNKSDKESITNAISVVMSDKIDSIYGLSAEELGLAVYKAAANARIIKTP